MVVSPKKKKSVKTKTGTALGIHITEQYIRAVLLKNEKGGVNIVYAREVPLPKGVIVRGEVVKATVLEKKLASIHDEVKTKKARIVVPHDCDDMDAYSKVLKKAGITPTDFTSDIDTLSQFFSDSPRLLLHLDEDRAMLVLNDGKEKSFVYIDRGIGEGVSIVEKLLDIDRNEAEEIYTTYGFLSTHHEKKLLYALTEYIKPITDAIILEFILARKNARAGGQAEEIVAYGDGADIVGLVEYIAGITGIKARHLDLEKDIPLPWSGVPKIVKKEALKFAPVIQATAREFIQDE